MIGFADKVWESMGVPDARAASRAAIEKPKRMTFSFRDDIPWDALKGARKKKTSAGNAPALVFRI
jgi:hypothetical protein